MRYGNDLVLTEIARSLTNYMADLNVLLRDGHSDSAKLISENMRERLARLEERLDEIKDASCASH
jgi:hypothetical protein